MVCNLGFGTWFQSTSSMRRMTCLGPCKSRTRSDFNPHPPCGGWLLAKLNEMDAKMISIHILHAEDDISKAPQHPLLAEFQSTSSMRRMTWEKVAARLTDKQFQSTSSMRRMTSRYDCDSPVKRFQSTSSMRRMTAKTAKIILIQNNFLTIFTKNNLSHY